jgi:hypothetical protein
MSSRSFKDIPSFTSMYKNTFFLFYANVLYLILHWMMLSWRLFHYTIYNYSSKLIVVCTYAKFVFNNSVFVSLGCFQTFIITKILQWIALCIYCSSEQKISRSKISELKITGILEFSSYAKFLRKEVTPSSTSRVWECLFPYHYQSAVQANILVIDNLLREKNITYPNFIFLLNF